MLHTKFRGYRSNGRIIIFKVLTIYGCGCLLGHVTKIPRTNCSPYPRRRYKQLCFDWIAVSETNICEIVDDEVRRTTTTDDGHTLEHGYTINSPMNLELKTRGRTGIEVFVSN